MEHTPDAARAALARLGRDESAVPDGPYCYRRDADGRRVPCPFWAIDPTRPAQLDGYCALLDLGDWDDDGVSHLFDQVKACGIRDGIDEDDEDSEDGAPPPAGQNAPARGAISPTRLAEIAAIPDEAIDTADIPEQGAAFFAKARRRPRPAPPTE